MPALGSRDFRLFWVGNVIAVSGQQMWTIVQPWIIYELSGSKLLLGLSGLAQAVPATLLTLFGGVIADKVDQKRLLLIASALQVFIMLALAAIALTENLETWHVMVGLLVFSVVSAFEGPARHAIFPRLTERRYLANAVALNATIHPGTRIGAPIIAGFLLAVVMDASSAMIAAGVIYVIAAIGFIFMIYFLLMVNVPDVRRAKGGNVLADMADGVRFIWKNRIFAVLIGTVYFTQFFGHAIQVLFPVFAKDVLGVGPSGLGLMYTAMGIGSFTAATIAATAGNARNARRFIVIGGLTSGLSILLFSASTWYPISIGLLFFTGLGSSTVNVAIQTNIQMLVGDDFRGRVMGLWGMVHTSVRPMGEMGLGSMAAIASAPIAVGVGAVAILAFVLSFILPNRNLRRLPDLREAALAEHR
jgi:MFS family permease